MKRGADRRGILIGIVGLHEEFVLGAVAVVRSVSNSLADMRSGTCHCLRIAIMVESD